ncbi:MAG TPA: TetR/AcrR family transcriptional regulator; helix-turn-helix transcriptional regulator [Candidatus Agrococcus pullicola]|uniref:TetR/AcrR family transcriptional regulator helix-turn-helix transcriptional regulator n=1 Tax=Candidatus Agrococcus pullicola TaxID=2838429 RepID=A0A9D1YWY2_9MICO|nr:TetR/AcrR family transcriptional regulator; helix-turn-helix transcriptional regulator [Candidatus Agrococcus pullicola]
MDLFESQGFEETTVTQIAARAGVTEMTFFRHFPSKDLVVLTDPYDPAIADSVAAQPADASALIRAVHGIRRALDELPEPESELVQRRVRIIAGSASLRARSAEAHIATQMRISEQLVAGGADVLVARTVAAAVLAALTAALFEWARDERWTLRTAIAGALDALESHDG